MKLQKVPTTRKQTTKNSHIPTKNPTTTLKPTLSQVYFQPKQQFNRHPAKQLQTSKSFIQQTESVNSQQSDQLQKVSATGAVSDRKLNTQRTAVKGKKGSVSRNSQQSLGSMQNKFVSVSSKGLLSTMHSQNNNHGISNQKQYSSEQLNNGQLQGHFQSQESLKPLNTMTHNFYFTTQDSDDAGQEVRVEVLSDIDQEFTRSKYHINTHLVDQKNHIPDQADEQQNDNRRESMASFKDDDINEGTKYSLPKQEIRQTLKPYIRQPNSLPKNRIFEIRRVEKPSDRDVDAVDNEEVSKFEQKIKEQEPSMVVLSIIDQLSNINPTDSKNSFELEMLMNLSTIEGKNNILSAPFTKQQSLNSSTYNQITPNTQLRHKIRQSSQQYTLSDKSSPILIHIDENQSQQSQASESIKNYLSHLKTLKKKYQDIVNELLVEENMNIQQTTMQVLSSDEFKRLSIGSGTELLSNKIIEIRDEYRHVIQLLKSQHNFSEVKPQDDSFN